MKSLTFFTPQLCSYNLIIYGFNNADPEDEKKTEEHTRLKIFDQSHSERGVQQNCKTKKFAKCYLHLQFAQLLFPRPSPFNSNTQNKHFSNQ